MRDGDWTVAPIPPDLLDRRVEITGPVDRKMIINALNSGANVFMADFEDSTRRPGRTSSRASSTCATRCARTIAFDAPETARRYALNEQTATLMVRPARLAPAEKHVLVDGEPMSGSLFDFGLFFFHNADELLARGHRPVLLPAEAGEPPRGAAVERRLRRARRTSSGIPRGTIRRRS